MTDDSTFFQIAAALLPALMLGGLLSDLLKPPPKEEGAIPRLPWKFWVITWAGGYFVFAETMALDGAITGEPTDFQRVIVSVALVGAAVGVVLLLALSWIERLPTLRRRLLNTVALLAFLAVTAAGGVRVLDNAVRYSTAREQLDEFVNEDRRLADESQALLDKTLAAEQERWALLAQRAQLRHEPRTTTTRARLFALDVRISGLRTRLALLRIRTEGLNSDQKRLWKSP